jgi:hypothetical protein
MKGTIVLIAKRGTLSVRLVAYMSRYILTRPAKRVGSVTSESVVAMAGRAGWQAPACLLHAASLAAVCCLPPYRLSVHAMHDPTPG